MHRKISEKPRNRRIKARETGGTSRPGGELMLQGAVPGAAGTVMRPVPAARSFYGGRRAIKTGRPVERCVFFG